MARLVKKHLNFPYKLFIEIKMPEQGLGDFLSTLKEAAVNTQAPSESRPAKKQKTTSSSRESSEPNKNVSFGYTEINKYEHCARSLQKNIRTIVDEAPTFDQLQQISTDDSIDRFAKLEAKTNPLLSLVSKLKTLYNAQKIQIFDQILENNVVITGGANKGDANTKANNDNQAKVAEKTLINEDLSEKEETVANGLPPLPKINSPELYQRVFQHKSTNANKTYLNTEEIVMTNNERMEFLGDSVMNNIVTVVLFKRFPHANEGQLSQIRAQIISNKTLAEYSIAYGFDKQLVCNIHDKALQEGRQKVIADIFEAYVGALAIERGYDLKEVENWLVTLMEEKFTNAEKLLKKMQPVNKDAKTELYSLIGSASLHPVYQVTHNGNGIDTPFKVLCLMEDVVLGTGEAPSLKDAGLKAAMSALRNHNMLEKYGRKRLETDRSNSSIKPDAPAEVSSDKSSGKFPVVADKNVLPNKFAKNEAYAYFGKNLGLLPEYTMVYEEENKRFKAELRVKNFVVSVAYDANKKNAMSRAASVILENKQLLPEIVNYIT